MDARPVYDQPCTHCNDTVRGRKVKLSGSKHSDDTPWSDTRFRNRHVSDMRGGGPDPREMNQSLQDEDKVVMDDHRSENQPTDPKHTEEGQQHTEHAMIKKMKKEALPKKKMDCTGITRF